MTSENSSKKGKVEVNNEEDDLLGDMGENPEETNPHADITLLLKEMAETPDEPIDKIATEMDIPVPTANAIVKEFVMQLIATHREADFPERMRKHYNSFVKHSKNKLDNHDMITLMGLIKKFHSKLLASQTTQRERDKIDTRMAKLRVPGVIAPQPRLTGQPEEPEEVQQVVQVPIPPTSTQQNMGQSVTFTDTQPPIQQQQQQQQQQPRQTSDFAPYDNEESLIKFLLESNVRIRDPNRIRNFMQMFRYMKNDLLATPQKLLILLKSSFEPAAAEAVWMMFMDMKAQVSNDSSNLYKLTGASDYRPVNQLNLEQYLGASNPALREMMQSFGQTGQSSSPSGNPFGGLGLSPQQVAQDAQFDRQLERMQKMITMTLMQNMANNSVVKPGGSGGLNGEYGLGGVNPNDYDIYEDYGQDGRVTGRRMIRKAGAAPWGYPGAGTGGYPPVPQDGKADKSMDMMMEFLKMANQASMQDRQLLIEKLSKNDQAGLSDIVGTILKQAVGVIGANSDPLQGLNRMMELSDKMNQIRRPEQPKSIEEKKLELDFMIAKKDMEREDRKEERDFMRQQEETRAADDRIGHVIEGLGNVAKDAIGPILQTVTGSFGRGLVPPGAMPPGAMGMPPQQQLNPNRPPEKIIIKEVPQQQPVVQPAYNNMYQPPGVAPTYTPDQIAQINAAREAQIRQEYEQRMQQQQQQQGGGEDNRPIEEQLKEYEDSELETLASQMESQMIQGERAFHKVLAERNKRRIRSGGTPINTPQRNYVAPIVQEIAEHERQQQAAYEQALAQANAPQEPRIDPFADEPTEEPSEPNENEYQQPPYNEDTGSGPATPDLSHAYDNPEVQESLRLAGQLQEPYDDSSFGVPSASSLSPEPPAVQPMPQNLQEPQEEEEGEEGQVTYNPDDIDMSNDTVVEG
jgi:hypothetical protein